MFYLGKVLPASTALIVLLISICLPVIGYTQQFIPFNLQQKEAYQLATSLRLEAASKIINDQLQRSSNDPLDYLLADYIDFFKLFITEDSNLLGTLEKAKKRRIDKIKSLPIERSLSNYITAEINLHWSLIYIRFDQYYAAFTHVRRSYKLLEQNRKDFPDFIPTYKSLGILHAMVGSVPDRYKGIFSFFSGMEGTIRQGKGEIETVLEYGKSNPDFLLVDETVVVYALLLLHLGNEQDDAWQLMSTATFQDEDSPLITFVRANVAMHTGRNDQAIQWLSEYQADLSELEFPYLYFMQGLALLRKLDPSAIDSFQKYIQTFKGKNYIKESFQKWAWAALLQGDTKTYHQQMQKCRMEGDNQVDGDKQAMQEAVERIVPNPTLLTSRLLFDGGYYQQSIDTLLQHAEVFLSDPSKKNEYAYRLARIYHEQGATQKAIEQYQLTIRIGSDSPEYYACNAALQLGLIYEKKMNKKQAVRFFELCKKLRPNKYRTSLHMKAKAGLDRMQ